MRNIRDFFMVLLFFSLLTYFVLFFKKQESSPILDNYTVLSEYAHNNQYFVVRRENGVSISLPVENYLVGALAASVSVEYGEELLKAQAVLLRSTLCSKYKEANAFLCEAEEMEFWSDTQMQNIWGDAYEENVKKCLDAVTQTQGVYLVYKNEPIEGFFHGMSAGSTRDGAELSESGKYGYLKATLCADNLSAADYETEVKISAEKTGFMEHPVTNEAGYVISLQRDGKQVSGEELRSELGLQSSHMTWEKEGEYYIVKTNGKGHGFGLDQYYGNVLAKKGMDYQEILAYFFTDITYRRME